MAGFMIRFLLSNVFLGGIIGILLAAKCIFKNSLSGRMQYHLWLLLTGLFIVPFLPFRFTGFSRILSWPDGFKNALFFHTGSGINSAVGALSAEKTNWLEDFAISVNGQTPPAIGYLLAGIWMAGMAVAALSAARSLVRLHRLEKSALPLQNPEIHRLYRRCLDEMDIRKNIPVYSTAFLKSPVITGLLKPRIYLPIHLISDCREVNVYSDMQPAVQKETCRSKPCPDTDSLRAIRYMLLHELQHYKHRDTLISFPMNLAGIVYWFNPFVRYALRAMQNDREVACDTSVLNMLEEKDYEEYGNTLIGFAEKISRMPFPFATGFFTGEPGRHMEQMKRRMINLASYERPTSRQTRKGVIAFTLTAILLVGLAPSVSTYAADTDYYHWKPSSQNISHMDLSSYFENYEGSFVLYDLKSDAWSIYNADRAALRIPPDSTYKIYDGLFGLEHGVITPDDSLLPWNGEAYPFEAWNKDQTLQSAMDASVNWYFQEMDERIGRPALHNDIQKIGYGNKNIGGGLSSCWMESSLKISPIEQVELLIRLHNNSFGFAPENIEAVKASIRLFSSATETFYGKTGTGRIDGQDVNGWFVGFIEAADNTYFFAVNISADCEAAGSRAAEIAMDILNEIKTGMAG